MLLKEVKIEIEIGDPKVVYQCETKFNEASRGPSGMDKAVEDIMVQK